MANTSSNIQCVQVSAIVVVCMFLTACITPPNIKYTEGESFSLLTTTSAESSIIILDEDNALVFCSEPTSNLAINGNADLSLSGAIGGTTDSASDSMSVKESQVIKGSGNILLVREVLYRTCEFISNSNLSEEEKRDVFLKALELVTDSK